MSHTVREIAESIGARAVGDTALFVERLSEPGAAGADDLAIALSPRYAATLAAGKAGMALLWDGADWHGMGLKAAILMPEPRLGLARVTAFWDQSAIAPGIHPSAIIDSDAVIDPTASIGPLAVIGARSRIGAGAVIGAHCVIGPDCWLGAGARLGDGVKLGVRVVSGARLRVQSGAVIGSDGFSFATAQPGPVDALRRGDIAALQNGVMQSWERVHSLGGVTIGDDVEIGANSTIDSGTLHPTRIGSGTKIDNLVMIGHNADVGAHCLLCGQVGLAGSVKLGDQVILGGQTGVKDHVRIGDHVITGAGTLILSHVASGQVLLGNPAQPLDRQIGLIRHLRRLSRQLSGEVSHKKRVFKPDPTE